MIEDLKQLVREFDLQALLNPQSPEQFLYNLVIVLILAVAAVVVWKALSYLLGGR